MRTRKRFFLTLLAFVAVAVFVRTSCPGPPQAPATPTGPDSGYVDVEYPYSTSAEVREDIQVSVRFDWGDGHESEWSGYVASGEPVEDSHAWQTPGTYSVRAQAMDQYGNRSEWSEPGAMTVIADGTLKWRSERGGWYNCCPAIDAEGNVYLGDELGIRVFGPDGADTLLFYGAEVSGSVSIDEGGILYACGRDFDTRYGLFSYGPDGPLRWFVRMPGRTDCSPAVGSDGVVYIAASLDTLSAVNSDGTLKWTRELDLSGWGSATVGSDGTVYIESGDDNLYAFNPDGTLKWRSDHSYGAYYSGVALAADGTIYCRDMDRADDDRFFLTALAPDGSVKWRFECGEPGAQPAVGPDGTIYFGSHDNRVYALNPDGSLKWRFETGSRVTSTPAVRADGVILVCSEDHYLYALDANGLWKWRFDSGERLAHVPVAVAPDGTIYFSPIPGEGIVALYGSSPLAEGQWPKFQRDLVNSGRAQ